MTIHDKNKTNEIHNIFLCLLFLKDQKKMYTRNHLYMCIIGENTSKKMEGNGDTTSGV
jgi:hypothetical protein